MITQKHDLQAFSFDNFIQRIDPKLAAIITSILMNDERYRLHNWEKNNIFPKPKDLSISQLVSETILSLRCFLFDQKVTEFKIKTQDVSKDHSEVLEDVLNYSNLKMLLSRKLNRVLWLIFLPPQINQRNDVIDLQFLHKTGLVGAYCFWVDVQFDSHFVIFLTATN